jgi:CAAX protease family protein
VITKEPSQDVTPLSDEPAGFPAPVVRDDLTPPPAERTALPAWAEATIGVVYWIFSVFVLAVVPVAVALPYLIYQIAEFGVPRPEALATDKTLIFLSIIGILPAHLLTLAVAWLFVTKGSKRPFLQGLRFVWPTNTSPAVTTMLCFLLAVGLLIVGWGVTTLWGGSETQLDLLVKSSMAARVATALVAVVTAPLVEEVIYRGVVYSAFERAAGKVIAVLFVSLLFAGVHVLQYSNNIGVIIVITILSFTLSLARAYTGSLIPPFIIHLVFNGIQSLFILLTPFIDKNLLEKTEEITPTTPGFELAGHLIQALWRMT